MNSADRAPVTPRDPAAAPRPVSGPQPNILIILVDQLRYPSVFPAGVDDAAGFLSWVMPNVYHKLWQRGVKFTHHFAAAVACTPARSTIITGLYSHQTWLLLTIGEHPFSRASKQPWLDPAFPTYGKLLSQAGYQTPYIGKWHLSIPPEHAPRLEEYGFQGLTQSDPIGANLQGTVGDHAHGYLNDGNIAEQARSWLSGAGAARTPWCLTVSFINPHDIEKFWGGTEFRTYHELFDRQRLFRAKKHFSLHRGTGYPPVVPWDSNPLKDPPSYGYPAVPPNWESAEQIKANKPSIQAWAHLYQQVTAGGVAEDPNQAEFTIAPLPRSRIGIAKAPYSYWRRALDCYTQLMSIVDARIGEVLDAIPASQLEDTVVIFTSDHGNYAGAHGFPVGKSGTLYDEAYHVPLIVADPSGRFTADIETPRAGLTSSVDLLPMLVTLGHNGSAAWQHGINSLIYDNRHDVVSMLRSAQAPGRDYVLLAANEVLPAENQKRRQHLLALRTQHLKLGTYAKWSRGTTTVSKRSLETEFYDYGTAGGRAEVSNTPDDPRAARALASLLDNLIPNELEAPLPAAYAEAQAAAKRAYLDCKGSGAGGAHAERVSGLSSKSP